MRRCGRNWLRWAYQRVDQSSQSTLEALACAVERPLVCRAQRRHGPGGGDPEGLARHELLTGVEVRTPVGNLVAQYPLDRANSATEASSLFVTRRLASPPACAKRRHRHAGGQHPTRGRAGGPPGLDGQCPVGQPGAGLTVVLYFAAERLISRPIVKLSDRLRQITPGGTRRLRKPSRHSRDEIGQLIDSANALIIASETALGSERRIGIP